MYSKYSDVQSNCFLKKKMIKDIHSQLACLPCMNRSDLPLLCV